MLPPISSGSLIRELAKLKSRDGGAPCESNMPANARGRCIIKAQEVEPIPPEVGREEMREEEQNERKREEEERFGPEPEKSDPPGSSNYIPNSNWPPAYRIPGVPNGTPVPPTTFMQAPGSSTPGVDSYFTYTPSPQRPGEYNEDYIVGQNGEGRTPPFLRNRAADLKRRQSSANDRVEGEPVVVTRGEYVEDWEEFRLDGTIPIVAERHYGNQMDFEGPLGRNRISLFDAVFIVNQDNTLAYRDERGRTVAFVRPLGLIASRNARYRHLSLSAPWLKKLDLRDRRLTRRFQQGRDRVYRLVCIEDDNGNSIQLTRSAEGWLTQAQHSDGYRLAFVNDGYGRRRSVTLVSNGVEKLLAAYGYDANGNMTEADCACSFSIRYDYDDRNRLVGWRDGSGRSRSAFAYDEANRVVRTETSGPWDGDRFEYDSAAGRTLFLPGGGDTAERFDFNEEEDVHAETDGLGNETRHVHEDGYLKATIDPLGHETTFAYDDDGNVTQTTDAEGRRTMRRWFGPDQLVLHVDGEGGVHRFDYDERGNIVMKRDPLGNETRYEWTSAGRPAVIHFPDGSSEHRSYDEHHRLATTADAKGGVTRYVRDDPFGRVTTIVDPCGGRTRFAYDDVKGKPLEAWTSTTRPDGVVTSRTFDAEGHVSEIRDGEGRVSRYAYGAFDQLVAVTDPKGGILSLAYDVRGLVSSVTNANGRSYVFERDEAGRVAAETDFDGRRLDYRRDVAGRVVERRNADGGRVTYAYDRSGLVTERCAFAPSVGTSTGARQDRETFTYDRRGSIIRAGNSAGIFTFVRDTAGRIVSEGANGRTIENRYDAMARRVERRVGAGLASYAYDALGALSALALEADGATCTINFRRDALGREIGRESGAFRLDQTFDAVGQLRRQTAFGTAGLDGDRVVERSYDWNNAFEPTAISDGRCGTTSYQYDGNGQVIAARQGEGLPPPAPNASVGIVGLPGDGIELERFAYDAAKTVSASDTALPGEPFDRRLTPWLSSGGGKVKAARGASGERILLTHDAQGRVIERREERDGFRPKTWRYAWNAFDRMASCKTPDGEDWIYTYDPFGRRTSKRRGSGEGRLFLWDQDVVVEDARIHADGTVAMDEAVDWHYAPGTFRPVARRQGNTILCVVTDHLGVPRDLCDQEGRAVWTRSHRLWGGIRAQTNEAANDDAAKRVAASDGMKSDPADRCPIVFPGQWADAETGLYSNRFRHYDPVVGQYASPDPIGLVGGTRPQAYVENALASIDPLGLKPTTNRGRRGSPATRKQLDEIRDQFLKDNPGYKLVAGGTDPATGLPLPEQYIPGAGGGTLGSSYPDLTFQAPDGSLTYLNTYDSLPDGSMTPREQTNFDRIFNQTGGPVIGVPK